MTQRVYNFGSGPAALPLPVLEEIQRDLVSHPELDASVLEISHRSKWFEGVLAAAEYNLRTLLRIPADYQVLFLQGGASLQFAMVPMNFLPRGGPGAEYVVTGSWGEKALAEAQKLGRARTAWSGKESGYVRTPSPHEPAYLPGAAYVHYTSNETIQGVEFFEEPAAGDAPLVCDASSDFLSRPMNVEGHALIYAGAQKNAGPAGVTIVVVRADLLDRVPEGLPAMLDCRLLAREHSHYNTPPVFAIYVVGLVTRWLLETIGGLEKMEEINCRKAGIVYEALDTSGGFYRGHAEVRCRSRMNVTFRLASEDLEKTFVAEAKSRGMIELKGHRSVGGIRASLYNAVTLEAAEALAGFLREFRARHG
ncbi:MAG TPA: 3-phosphoserine/phosphohydroxythreonine transaminase [Candidatus Acidoferrales bacterium]|nr:3-phosphoserine/phosphohydroxythreonine transaminase [Candidatus Acidoferrales bacterium]